MQNREYRIVKSKKYFDTNFYTVLNEQIIPDIHKHFYLNEFRIKNDLIELLIETRLYPSQSFKHLIREYSTWKITKLFKELSYTFEMQNIEDCTELTFIDNLGVATITELPNIKELNKRYLKLKENFEIVYEID